MTPLMIVLVGLVLVVLAADLWVRLAPLPPARFHKMGTTNAPGEWPGTGGFAVALPLSDTPQAALARIDRIIMATTPRTRRLSGSIVTRHLSYVSRSALWGFPDITNVWIAGDTLQISGHLRFGRSDLGVNQARIRGWLAALAQS